MMNENDTQENLSAFLSPKSQVHIYYVPFAESQAHDQIINHIPLSGGKKINYLFIHF
jgi:hypothetical protein